MRILALETSSVRGSVALWEGTSGSDRAAGGRVVAYLKHEVHNEHAERMLTLAQRALAQAGWKKSDVERIAVGVGPGSFTGVRVALALSQGLILGLGVPGVGVGSLRIVAAGLESEQGPLDPRVRVVVRDARREEFFLAAYGPRGDERIAPHAILQQDAAATIRRSVTEAGMADGSWVVVGTPIEGLPCANTDQSIEPDARALARIAADLDPLEHPVAPQYVRGPNVVRPKLPPSPLAKPRT